jgi:hypothetical protein
VITVGRTQGINNEQYPCSVAQDINMNMIKEMEEQQKLVFKIKASV